MNDEPSDAVWTIPNAISALRIALIPLFVGLILDPDTATAGLVLFAIVVATDWVDGAIARGTACPRGTTTEADGGVRGVVRASGATWGGMAPGAVTCGGTISRGGLWNVLGIR